MLPIFKGVPQAQFFAPSYLKILLTIFSFLLKKTFSIYNYADDNALSKSDKL
jgi:hypothetical protein